MSKSAVISFRVSQEDLAVLDRLADAHGRSRAWIVNHLLKDAARQELELLGRIEEGIAAIEAGDFCTHEELMQRVEQNRAARRAA